jgi:hypothetical protein
MDTPQNEVGELVRELENDYTNGVTTINKYVEFSQSENIDKVEAYLYSKHTSGDTDSQGREKPFFDIVTAAVNIWYRATTIARTMIRIKGKNAQQAVLAFVATLLIQDWMRKSNFDEFLNKWDLTEARYGSAVTEFVEQEGDLKATVLPWNRLITDMVEFEGNPLVKILWLTPAQLKKNKQYDPDQVKALLDAKTARETTGRQKKDNKANYIKVYELHGELELSKLTGNMDDEDEYVQQIQVVSFLAKKGKRGEYDDFVLYKGKEKNPHMITHLIKEDARTQGIGAVEHLFEAQWMVNHSAKQIKDYLDFSSKLFFQTADSNLVGQNVLNGLETGDILVHAVNSPLSLVNTLKADITAIQNFSAQWQVLGKEITSTPDAISGATQPSGTPFRSLATENQEAHSLFEVMKRSKKRDLERMVREFIIPYVKKQMDTSEEIAAILEAQDITMLDQMYVPNEAIRRNNDRIKKQILSGQTADNVDPKTLEPGIRNELSSLGNQRFVKPADILTTTWQEVLKDFEWDCEVDIEDKKTDDQIVADTLVDFFKLLVDPNAQAFIETPKGKMMFNKILDKTNAISPIELASLPSTPQIPQQPQQTNGGSTAAPVTQVAPTPQPNAVQS